jgi:hypothetical protein
MIVIILKLANSAMPKEVEEVMCKHWAVAGAMRGLISLWELYAGSLFSNGYCYIPSLQNIRCCNYNTGLRQEKLIYESVWNPQCCYVSEECCQPNPVLPYPQTMIQNSTYFTVPNSDENPHPEYFIEEKQSYSRLDVIIISLFGGAFVTVMIICGITLYYAHGSRNPKYLPLQSSNKPE